MSQSRPRHDDTRISVIIPCHNGERFLAEAIRSVETQTYPVHEIIVVDDLSTDKSIEVARSFDAVSQVVTRTSCGGPGSARNDGIARSTGNWIALLDADDIWHPDKIALQMNALSVPETNQVLTCMVEEFLSEDTHISEVKRINLRTQVGSIPSTMLFSRKTFHHIGHFSENDRAGAETMSWVLEARSQNVQFVPVAEAVVYRRIHDNNMGRTVTETQRAGYLVELKRSLDARRLNKT